MVFIPTPTLEPRLSVLTFLQSCNTKSRTESLSLSYTMHTKLRFQVAFCTSIANLVYIHFIAFSFRNAFSIQFTSGLCTPELYKRSCTKYTKVQCYMYAEGECTASMAIATSYERTRANTYSEDLRWRIIYKRKALSYSLQHVAENLGVGSCNCTQD